MPIYLVGILTTVFIVSQITVSLFAGRIAHAIRDTNVIRLSIAASGVAWLILLLTRNGFAMGFAFLFGGLSSGLFEPIGNSLVAKMASSQKPGERRSVILRRLGTWGESLRACCRHRVGVGDWA